MTCPTPALPVAGPDILHEAVLTLETRAGTRRLGLSSLLAHLLTNSDAVALPRIPIDQHGPVWRFLVRSAAQALHDLRSGLPEPKGDCDALAALLASALGAAAGADGAFMLYNPIGGGPAFLQPPVAGGANPAEAGYQKGSAARLALAVGGKNHERKKETDRSLSAEALIYALIAYQSGVIYTKGNYAAQLMGSATGKGAGMPFMGVRFDGPLERSFRHDVAVMLDRWEDVRRERGLAGTVWALWTLPWDGEVALGSEQLTPGFIPCARLVRIDSADADGRYGDVWFMPSRKARVEDRTQGSGLGDPFLPQVPHPKRPGDYKARGTMGTGYRYDEVARLLFGGEDGRGRPSPSVAAVLDAVDAGTVRVIFEGMAFDQGKTLGFHRREVLLPEGNLLDLREPDLLREMHGAFLRHVKEAQGALRGAARILLQGVPRKRPGDEAKAEFGATALQHAVDDVYLDALLEAVRRHRSGDASGLEDWAGRVRDMALAVFEQTKASLPTPSTQRLRRQIDAESFLRRKLVPVASHTTPSPSRQ